MSDKKSFAKTRSGAGYKFKPTRTRRWPIVLNKSSLSANIVCNLRWMGPAK
jgi:hypothetical protein